MRVKREKRCWRAGKLFRVGYGREKRELFPQGACTYDYDDDDDADVDNDNNGKKLQESKPIVEGVDRSRSFPSCPPSTPWKVRAFESGQPVEARARTTRGERQPADAREETRRGMEKL